MFQRFIDRGGAWVVFQALLMAVVFPGALAWPHQWNNRATWILGVAFIVLAAWCGVAGTIGLGRNLSPFPTPKPGAYLVQRGIYGLIRHPLYTAVFLGSLGWAMIFASAPSLVAAICLGPFFDAKARREERALRRQFPEYKEYEKRVKRFIPFVY